MSIKKWVLREAPYVKLDPVLQAEPELVQRLLILRGITSAEQAQQFLSPDYERDLGDPLEILNMDRAVERILRAIKSNEKIIIFGDYDADGVCSCVIFYDFFKKIGFKNFEIYIPDRYQEGHGLTFNAIDSFIRNKANLIITIDCGITNYEAIEKANKAGIDVIVIDHHLVPAKSPPAYTIIDLYQKDEQYPFKDLAAVGLAFKTVCAILKRGSFDIIKGWEKWLLDVVALGTITDMVPLQGENRALVFYGLKVLQKTQRIGLRALYNETQVDSTSINSDDVGFLIGPRINIAGRMDHATTSFLLLTTQSESEARWLASRLDQQNNERKILVGEIFKKINTKYQAAETMPDIIIAGEESWSPGLLGIVANKVLETYCRPVIIWGKNSKGDIIASCRSNGSINLVELMKKIGREFFVDFGGHALAAGFTLSEGKIKELEVRVEQALKKISKKEIPTEVLWIDQELSLEDVNWKTLNLIEQFQPFGVGNPRPIFLLSNLVVENVKTFGNEGIHLQIDFKKQNGERLPAVGFFMENDFEPKIKKGSRIDLVASIEKSTFKGYNELRLRIIDIRIAK